MLISIIIPVYNVNNTLKRAVDSCTGQSYKDLEIILVDDGSTDGSGQLCDEIAASDQRIKVIHKENGGLSSARNAGIEQATGSYIAFLDSDDEFVLDIMETFIADYQKQACDLYIFNLKRVFEDGSAEIKKADNTFTTDNEQAYQTILDNNGLDFYAWNKIYKASLLETTRFPEGTLYEDNIVSYTVVKEACSVLTTDKIGILYYENKLSIVAQNFNPKQMDNVYERLKILDDVKISFPDLTAKTARRAFDGFLSTAFKLACSDNSEHFKQYDKQLKEVYQSYKSDFDQANIDWKKKLAWKIYNSSPKVYTRLYKAYLGK